MQRFHNINGSIVPADQASLKVNDLSILRGFGIFDYFLFWNQTPLFVEDYLSRFLRSANKINLEVPFSRAELRDQIQALIKVNQQENGAIRLVLTGGYATDSYTPIKPNLLILHHDAKAVPQAHFDEGIKLMAHEYQRDLPEVKTTNYAMGISLIPKLNAIGAVEPLYHSNGTVKEGVRANFFIIDKNDKVITSNSDILFGITRLHTLKSIENHFEIEKRPLAMSEVLAAKEAFVTGSNRGVVPVTSIDHHLIGDGRPGSKVKQIISLFDSYRKNYVQQQSSMATLS